MRLLAACSLGGAGHFTPLRAFLTQPGGNDVMLAGPPALADMASGAGLAFWPCGEPPEAVVAPIRDQLALASRSEAAVLGNRELFGRLATTAMLPGMARLFSSWAPELVLRDPCEYASAVLSQRTSTPMAQVAISFADVEAASTRIASPALEVHEPGLTDALFASPYLTKFPESLDPSTYPTTIRYREAAPVPRPLPAWWADDERPLVYLTLGTVLGHMSFAGDAYAAMLEAVAPLDVRVLLTTGRGFDPARLARVPPNVHVETWVDQADVLGAADLVVCHGGSGTVLGALGSAVPLVVVPTFADQFENGRRLASAGAGLVVDTGASRDEQRQPPGAGDVVAITAAITEVLGAPRYAAAAARLGTEMAAAPLAADALTAVTTPSGR